MLCNQRKSGSLRHFHIIEKFHVAEILETMPAELVPRWDSTSNENLCLYMLLFYDQPTEAPTVEKSSAAKDPTDPPSHVGSKPAATDMMAGGEGELSQCCVMHAVSASLRNVMEESGF